ncbi:MAG TPA: hypothetical protein VFC90_10650 [Planctomycetota bacterium]|nr:hypothetical protein [Planctomycetota bacterium]
MRAPLATGLILIAGFTAAQELPKAELKKRLKDDAHSSWIYDDLSAAFAEAKKTGKPILAVFRCVP